MSGFKDVVGHKDIITYIENAVLSQNVSHAYILNGDKGSGKKMLANLFAMCIQCESPEEDGDACGVCHSCKQALSGNNPDIITVVSEKLGVVGISDIRTKVVSDVDIRPYSCKHKVYIIPDADKMTEASGVMLGSREARMGVMWQRRIMRRA